MLHITNAYLYYTYAYVSFINTSVQYTVVVPINSIYCLQRLIDPMQNIMLKNFPIIADKFYANVYVKGVTIHTVL